MKSTTSITINPEILRLARMQSLNVSEIAEQALTNIVTGNTQVSLDLQKNMLRKAEITDQILKLQAELSLINESINQVQENRRKEEMQLLEKKKAELEVASKCVECGEIVGDPARIHKFPIGMICHSCFLNGKGKSKKWNMLPGEVL